MRYFWQVEDLWKNIYDSKNDMKILYNRWEEWIVTKGKEIKVGDGTKKNFHSVMGTWCDDENPGLKETISNVEDDDGFIFGDGYSSDRPMSRHSKAWGKGELRDDKRNDDNDNIDDNFTPVKDMGLIGDDNNNDDDDVPVTDNNINKDNPLVTGISGSPAENTRRGGRGAALLREQAEGSSESPAGNTRKGAMAKRA